MQHSLNVCLTWIATQMGANTFYDYLENFDLGNVTGIDLAHEVTGRLKMPGDEDWYEADLGTNSFGQGVTVTPLQMASLVGTVANNGVSYRPRLVRAVMDRTDGNLQELPTVPRGKIQAKPETFRLVKEALADVVTKGTATRAKSSIVTIGGKTGTAQVAALRTGPEESIPKKFRDHALRFSCLAGPVRFQRAGR